MPARWMLGLAFLALSLGAPLRAQPLPDAQAQVARCASQAKPTLAGLDALRVACPGVGRAIESLGLTALLPARWQKILTPHALAGLGALARRYGGPPLSPAPDAAALRAIAQGLKPPLPPPGWWDRVKAWLRHRTAPFFRELRQWLNSMVHSPAHRTLEYALFYALGGLLLLTVAVFAFIELRSAGLIGWERRPARARRRAGTATTSKEPTGESEPDWRRLRDQPASLLRVLVDALASAHRIEHERHLTCREISSRARFDTPRQREDFEHVAQLAERELYGPDAPAAVPEITLRAAKALRAELLAAPAGRKAGAR